MSKRGNWFGFFVPCTLYSGYRTSASSVQDQVQKEAWVCPKCGEKEKDDTKCIKCGALIKEPKKGKK